MKRGQIAIAGFADAAALAAGMMACACAVPTAFGIPFSPMLLAVFCTVGALLLSFWLNVPKYGYIFGLVFFAILIVIAVFQARMVADGAVVFFCRTWTMLPEPISRLYTFDALMQRAEAVVDPKASGTSFLMMLSAVFGLILGPPTVRSKMALLPVLLPLPPVLLSFLYTDQQPTLWVLMLLTVFVGYVLLGNGLRKGESPRRGLFSAGILLALGLLMLSILAIVPKSRYVPIPEEKRRSFFTDRFGEIADTAMSWFGETSPSEYDLKDQGDRSEDDEEAFRMRSTRSGTYHLRRHSYGQYSDSTWKKAASYDGEWRSMAALGARQENVVSSLSIEGSVSDERITPYAFTADDLRVEEAYVRANGATSYTWSFRKDYSLTPETAGAEELAYYAFAKEAYTMPDGAERDALLAIAQKAGLSGSGNAYRTALQTAAFVRNSGVYTLTPGEVPKGEDFVQYFLTKSHQGYCVHFAGATTALLQAMGVPARFTTGYYVTLPKEAADGGWYSVEKRASHAWTEVYVLGLGWVPIESTPGFGSDRGETGGTGPQHGVQAIPVPDPAAQTTPEPVTGSASPSPTPVSTPVRTTPAPTRTPPGTEPPKQGTALPDDGAGSGKTRTGGHGAWWLLIPLVPLAWVGIGSLLRRFREASFCRADAKRAIPDMAHYLKRLERFGVPKDPDAEEWALEAVFSDHRMKARQKTLLKRVHAAQRTVCANKPVRRFILRWILYRI